MKDYLNRLKDNCSRCTYAFWWVIRFITIGIFIWTFFDEPYSFVNSVQVLMFFGVMFVWEISMAMPAWTVFRYVRPVMQTLITIVSFVCLVSGHILDFYFEIRLWDSFLHFSSSVGLVFFGYEFACALIKKQQKTAPLFLIFLCSVGFSFMCTALWEIFEFTSDQIGLAMGTVGRSQFWSYTDLLGTAKHQTLFDYMDVGRYPIMDTMGDMVLNTLGAILGALILKIYPYRHKGRFKLDYIIPETEEN